MTPGQEQAGWIKLWRCLAWSTVWAEMPYSTGKLWLWLLMEATHPGNVERRQLPLGVLNHSIRFICRAMSWEDEETHQTKTPSPPTIYRSLKRLEASGNITREIEKKGPGGGVTVISICNYDTYQGYLEGGNNALNNALNNKHKNVKNKIKETTYPAEARGALAIWTAVAPLPETAKEEASLKALDELNRIDGLTWERINLICRHAAEKWVPQGFIASPAKLRKSTRSGEMKTWEAVERDAAKGKTAESTAEKETMAEYWDRVKKENQEFRIKNNLA